jgi:hypothetical protein
MAKPERSWTVTPNEPIEKLEDNLWVVQGAIPGNPKGTRRMAIVRMGDGRLVFYNAVPLDDAALAEVNAFGTPAFLVLPYNLHMMDGHAFAERLKLKIHGPKNDAKMAARVKVEGDFAALPADKTVRVESLDGTKNGEPVMIVESAGGARTSLMFADMFMNVPTAPGATLFARFAGIMGGPKIPWLIKAAFVKDKRALRSHYERLAAIPSLSRIVPSHGHLVTADAASVLNKVAATL